MSNKKDERYKYIKVNLVQCKQKGKEVKNRIVRSEYRRAAVRGKLSVSKEERRGGVVS